MNIHIGTSGFDYDDWSGVLYGPDTKRKDRLKIYAQNFSTLELNYTYYSMPDERNIAAMIEVTEGNLSFSVKANKVLTHTPGNIEENAVLFKKALQGLSEKRLLSAVLFQFPYSFHYTPENRKHLSTLLNIFGELPCCVEFRNDEWSGQSVISGLRKRGVALCSTDMPDLPGLSPGFDLQTADFGYLRLHGRNRDSWWSGDNVTRYDYNYTDREIESVAVRVSNLALKNDNVFVFFNNHRKGNAVKNAFKLQERLKSVQP
ncbi:MAG TPA: DUF72 domain-containing protein [bacterium]|nr:DUF72 domain-containing protein [bacterium]